MRRISKGSGFCCGYTGRLDVKGSGGRKNNLLENFQHTLLAILDNMKN